MNNSSTSTNPFDNIRKFIEAYQKSVKPINQMLEALQIQLEPFYKTVTKLQEFLAEFSKQIKENFVQGINSLEEPEEYDPGMKLKDGVHGLALYLAIFISDIDKTPFSYLKDRFEIGFDAHRNGNYNLSIFCIFSVIDGIITWFYCKSHDCNNYPTFNKKLENFLEIYKFEDIVGKMELKNKFDILIHHRNEIMHGGKYAHFDKNLSTIALLFLGIVYYNVRNAGLNQN